MKLFLSTLFLIGTIFNSQARECSVTLKKKTGKVYASAPGVIEVRNCQARTVTIRIKKTAGKAKTQVNFYVNGVMKAEVFNFKNGTYKNPNWSTYTIPNVKGKKVTVKVINQSIGNTFSYDCRIQGKTDRLTIGKSEHRGRIIHDTKKTIYTYASCTGKANISFTRLGGQANVKIRVYEKLANGQWKQLPITGGSVIDKSNSNYSKQISSSRPLKIEFKNFYSTQSQLTVSYVVKVTPG